MIFLIFLGQEIVGGCLKHTCDSTYDKEPYHAYNDFSVQVFVVLPHLKAIIQTKLFSYSR